MTYVSCLHVKRFTSAVKLDKVNVKGYTMYSLVDGLDWSTGDARRSGLYNVDFASDDKTRTPKSSAVTYRL